jgi:hypothetical protein
LYLASKSSFRDALKNNAMKRAIKAAAFVQGNVYWRVPYVGAQPEREDV